MLKPLKSRLLPVYNATIHTLRGLGDHLQAIATGNLGTCDVCGRFGPWLYRRRVIPQELVGRWGLSPRLALALARKESSDCSWCRAKLRARRLAKVLLERFPTSRPCGSVREWVRTNEAKSLRVAEFNRIEGLHDILEGLPSFQASDFHPNAAPGEVVNGARSEDLTRLTYPNESFDLVLTSETLEHVPNLEAALAEIRRVLVPGGRHLFTVPLLPNVPNTFPRARLLDDGKIESLNEEIRHPGGDVGYLVFHEFGADLTSVLEQAGFETEMRFGPVREDDIAQVFISRKR